MTHCGPPIRPSNHTFLLMKPRRTRIRPSPMFAWTAVLITMATAGCAGGHAAVRTPREADTSQPGYARHAVDHRISGGQPERPADHPALTLEDLFLRPRFGEVMPLQTRWAERGSALTFLWPNESSPGLVDVIEVDLETGKRSVLIDGSDLAPADTGREPAIEDYALAEDGRTALLFTDAEQVWREKTKGTFYTYDVATRALKPVGDRAKGPQMFAKLSPKADYVGFVRNRNLFLNERSTGQEIQITFDDPAAGIINGTYDWVYEEEFRLRDGWRWSPDGSTLTFVQLDESMIPEFAMADLRTTYPTIIPFRYPKAGEKNSEIRIGTYHLSSGTLSFFDTSTWNAGDERYEYLVGLGWTPPIDGVHHVWTIRMNRGQDTLELLFLNPITGDVRVVLEESEPTWIEVEEDADWTGVSAGKIRFLEDGEHFVWVSETSGFRHLYLHGLDGRRRTAITSGEWDVTGFHGVVDGQVFFSSSEGSSLERHAWKVPLAGGVRSGITEQPGWNDITLSPDGRFFLHTYSAPDVPTITAVRSIAGEVVWLLEDNRALAGRVAAYDLPALEFLSVPGADGTPLDAYLIKPSHFDSTGSYPLLVHVYGGPGSKEVSRGWGGVERLWHHYLSEKYGVLVAGIDGRGTGYRGKSFRSAVHRQLGVPEAEDQIAAARHLAARPWIDGDRLGIWGWSYGGTMTLLSMLIGEGPQTFRMGMSVAPVTDWRLYDTIYTERYMSTPDDNAEGYARSAATAYADRLDESQALLLVHGDLDDNVHFQNTVQMVNALQDAGKEFSVMFYPGTNHRISGGNRTYLVYRSLTRFVADHLLPLPTATTQPAP